MQLNIWIGQSIRVRQLQTAKVDASAHAQFKALTKEQTGQMNSTHKCIHSILFINHARAHVGGIRVAFGWWCAQVASTHQRFQMNFGNYAAIWQHIPITVCLLIIFSEIKNTNACTWLENVARERTMKHKTGEFGKFSKSVLQKFDTGQTAFVIFATTFHYSPLQILIVRCAHITSEVVLVVLLRRNTKFA